MHRQPKPTEEQIELIKKLDKLKLDIWESKLTAEIIEIGKKAIELSKNTIPTTYILANGNKKVDTKGKELITEVLENDIKSLENRGYSTLDDEKFAVVSSIQLLIRVFAHLSADEMIKILRE